MLLGSIPIGTRVRVVAFKQVGSARLLDGLTGEVIAAHFVKGWVKIRLDPNNVTKELDWSIAVDRLMTLEEEAAYDRRNASPETCPAVSAPPGPRSAR